MRSLALQRAFFFGVPAAALAAAAAGVARLAGTAWPWHSVVHEDGVRTLLGTIFYFEHATRELLPDLALALAAAGAVRHFYPPRHAGRRQAAAASWRRRLGAWSAAAILLILVGTAWDAGGGAILDNLAQLPTRAGAPPAWGAHWRYHLVERFAELLAAFGATGVLWLAEGRPETARAATRPGMYGAALAIFAGSTLLFRPTMEPFSDPKFLGHQLRELLTHSLVTLPLALGVCVELARRFSTADDAGRSRRAAWPVLAAVTGSVLCGAFLLAASVATGARSQGQQSGLAALLFPHFFEHSLGYALVPALAGFLYLWPSSGAGATDHRDAMKEEAAR